MTVSEWIKCDGMRVGCDHQLVFDCFEPNVGQCPELLEGYPIGFNSCGQGEPEDCDGGCAYRWYLGPTYCNPYVTNDMEFDPGCAGLYVSRLEAAWWWHVNGPGTGENMALVIETFEDFDDTCEIGDPNGQGERLGAVAVHFGYTEGDAGYRFFDSEDWLCNTGWIQLPRDGKGSYNIWLCTYEDQDPNSLYLATCAQPMLWGTGTNESPNQDCVDRGRGRCPRQYGGEGASSHQGPLQWDDDDPNGLPAWHDAPSECDDYAGLVSCPDPIGAMACFYVEWDGGWIPCGNECFGDIDCDVDTDLSDLCILLHNWLCEGPPRCPGDFDGDGDVDHSDLGILFGDIGCPDADLDCDEFGQNIISVSVVPVENSSVGPGDDPLEPTFHGGVTHFTFDLQVQVHDTDEDWGGARADTVLTPPNVEFFLHGLELDGYPPDPNDFDSHPALEFDSFWTSPSLFPNTGLGGAPFGFWSAGSRAADELQNSVWADMYETGADTFTIARFTIVVPPGGVTTPALVPAGTASGIPVIGTLMGSTTNSSTTPGCAEIAFDIIYRHCAGDIDGDLDTDQADLGELLSAWHTCPGDPDYNPSANLYDEGGPAEDCIDQQDLGVLLSDWGCGAEP